METYNNLNLLQLKNLKAKEKNSDKKNKIKIAINRIIKNSQVKWNYTSLLNSNSTKKINVSNTLSDTTITNTTITDDIEDLEYLEDLGEQQIKNNTITDSKLTNYDITKYYHKISKKNDNSDEIFNRMVNFADFLTNKPNINKEDIEFIRRPFEENRINKKHELGKRKYINL